MPFDALGLARRRSRAELFGGPLSRFRSFDFAIAGHRRRRERLEEFFGDSRHRRDCQIEALLIRLGWCVETADLSHELK